MPTYHIDVVSTPVGIPEKHIFRIPVNEPVIRYVSVWFDERYLGILDTRAVGVRLLDHDQPVAPVGNSMSDVSGPGPGGIVNVDANEQAYIWSKNFRVDWVENYRMRGPGYDLKVELFFETLPTVTPVRVQIMIVTARR